MAEPVSRLGKIVSEAREQKGLTPLQLAEKCGVTNQAIWKLETKNEAGKKLLFAVSKELNIPYEFLLEEAGKYVPRQDFTSESVEMINILDQMPQEFRDTARQQIHALFNLSRKFSKNEQTGEIQSLFMAVPVISDSAIAKEKPDKGEDSDGRTNDRNSCNRNSERRKAG